MTVFGSNRDVARLAASSELVSKAEEHNVGIWKKTRILVNPVFEDCIRRIQHAFTGWNTGSGKPCLGTCLYMTS